MAPDDTSATPAPVESPAEEFRSIGPTIAAKMNGDNVQANLSAVGTVTAGTLSATGSMIGVAAIDGDATVTASAVPGLMTRGDMTFQQSYASAVIVGSGGETKIHQAAAPLIIGKTMDLSQVGACSLVTGSADVKNSWVGIVISPKTTVSDDSKVMISTGAAIIIGVAIFGGMGLIALAIGIAARRAMRWRPTINIPGLEKLPDMHNLPSLASLSALAHKTDLHALQEKFGRHHAA